MNEAELERYLHRHIPISAAMGITVAAAARERVELRAALAPNLNHQSTAFGGSVASLAVLAGWSLVRIGLTDEIPVPQIVIQRSTIEYVAPVSDDFTAVCARPAEHAWDRFLQAFERRGRGRIRLGVDVRAGDVTVGHLTGEYVAVKGSEQGSAAS